VEGEKEQENKEHEEEEEQKQEQEEYFLLLPARFPCPFFPDRLQVCGTPSTLLTLSVPLTGSNLR